MEGQFSSLLSTTCNLLAGKTTQSTIKILAVLLVELTDTGKLEKWESVDVYTSSIGALDPQEVFLKQQGEYGYVSLVVI